MGIEDVVEHFIDSEYNINVPVLQSLLQSAVQTVDSAEETVAKEWGSDLLESYTPARRSEEQGSPVERELGSATQSRGLGEAVMWLAM